MPLFAPIMKSRMPSKVQLISHITLRGYDAFISPPAKKNNNNNNNAGTGSSSNMISFFLFPSIPRLFHPAKETTNTRHLRLNMQLQTF